MQAAESKPSVSRTERRRVAVSGGDGGLTLAHVGVPQVSVGVLIVEGGAQMALSAHGVVFTV